MSYREEAHKKLAAFLEKLDRREKTEFLILTNSWEAISSTLNLQIRKLSELEDLSANQLFRLQLYKDFLAQSKQVTKDYSKVAGKLIEEEKKAFAKLGVDNAQDLLGTRFYKKLPVEKINLMIANTQKGTSLSELLFKSYPETIDQITNTLVESMALGRNPIVTARLLKEDMDGNLTRALRIARTEQLNILREAQTLQYKESGIVKEKDWIGEPDACDSCLQGIAGNPYPLDEVMDTHPNCRCGWTPVL